MGLNVHVDFLQVIQQIGNMQFHMVASFQIM